MKKQILFYRTSEVPYGIFSNFDMKHPITLKGKIWPSTEHYFQAMKFEGTEHEEYVRLSKTPKEAAAIGRDRNRPLRKDWEAVKYDIMKEAVHAKFTQHEGCKYLLLLTGDNEIVEHTTNDRIWADGGDGSGQNLLGKILMEIRTQIKFQEDELDFMKRL